MSHARAHAAPTAKLLAGVQLDPAGDISDFERGLSEALPGGPEGRHRRSRDGQALTSERVGQRTQCLDRKELPARLIDRMSEAFRAPTRGEPVRVAPGTLQKPGARAKTTSRVRGLRGLDRVALDHEPQDGMRASTRHHRRVNSVLPAPAADACRIAWVSASTTPPTGWAPPASCARPQVTRGPPRLAARASPAFGQPQRHQHELVDAPLELRDGGLGDGRPAGDGGGCASRPRCR